MRKAEVIRKGKQYSITVNNKLKITQIHDLVTKQAFSPTYNSKFTGRRNSYQPHMASVVSFLSKIIRRLFNSVTILTTVWLSKTSWENWSMRFWLSNYKTFWTTNKPLRSNNYSIRAKGYYGIIYSWHYITGFGNLNKFFFFSFSTLLLIYLIEPASHWI